jgi:hypothetical protein
MLKLKITLGILVVLLFALPIILFAAPILRYDRTILPEADNLYDLGTTSLKWRNIFVNSCTGCGGGGVGWASTTLDANSIYFTGTNSVLVGNAVGPQLNTFGSAYIPFQVSADIDDGQGIYVVNKSLGTTANTFISLGNGGSPVTGPGYLATSTANIVFAGKNWNGTPLGYGALLKNDLAIYPSDGNLVLAAPTTTGNIKFITGFTGSFAGALDMILTSAGRLGVGTSTPTTGLELNNSTSNSIMTITNNTNNMYSAINFSRARTVGNFVGAYIGLKSDTSSANSLLEFGVNTNTGGGFSSTRMVIDNSGNVGIGTTTPQTPLNVVRTGVGGRTWTPGTPTIALIERSSTASAGAYLSVVSGNAGLGRLNFADTDTETGAGMVEYDHSNNHLNLYTGGSRAIQVTSDNKVGIGTGSSVRPTGRLDLGAGTNGECITWASSAIIQYSSLCSGFSGAPTFLGSGLRTATTSAIVIESAEVTMGVAAIEMVPFGAAADRGMIRFFTQGNQARVWGATSTAPERMRLTNAGRLGIATTTPGATLAVGGDILGDTIIGTRFHATGTTASQLGYASTTALSSGNAWFTGNVGIGTTSPDRTLTVSGTNFTQLHVYGTAGASAGGIRAFNDTGSAFTSLETLGSTSATGVVTAGDSVLYSTNNLQFGTGGGRTARMFISTAGNVGVGTAAPNAKFEISATGGVVPRITSTDGGGDAMQRFYSGSTFKGSVGWNQANDLIGIFGAASSATPVISVTSGARVGVGTTTPSGALHVNNTSLSQIVISNTNAGTNMKDWRFNAGASTFFIGTLSDATTASGDSAITIGRETNSNDVDYIELSTNNDLHKVRFTNDGNLGIGTTTPDRKLMVSGGTAGSNTGIFAIQQSTSAAANSGASVEFSGRNGSSIMTDMATIGTLLRDGTNNLETSDLAFSLKSSGTLAERVRITGAGLVGIGTTTPSAKLAITQTGTEDSFFVSDQTDPDPTPFRINATGNVFINASTSMATTTHSGQTPSLSIFSSTATGSTVDSKMLFHPVGGGNRTVSFENNQIQVSFTNSQSPAGLNLMPTIVANAGVGIGTSTNNWLGALVIQSPNNSAPSGALGNSALSLWNTTSEIFKVTNAGNVGISTTSPLAKLSVTNTGTGPSFIVEDTSSPDTTNFVIDSEGRVGIGVNSAVTAGYTLDVEGELRIGQGYGFYFNNSNVAIKRSANDLIFGGYSGIQFRSEATAIDSQTTRMYIDGSTGNVGIATTTPSSKLTVNGSSYLAGAVYATSTVTFTALTGATGGTNNDVCINATTGELVNETTGTCIVSSREYKKNISDLPISGLESVLKLRPVEFSWKENISSDYKDTTYGFIAEEVAEVDPHFAAYGLKGEARNLDDRAILATAVKAIQELAVEKGIAVKENVQDKWQWFAFGLLALLVIRQQFQINKLKK